MFLRSPDWLFYPVLSAITLTAILVPVYAAYRDQSSVNENILDSGIQIGFERLESLVTGPGIVASVALDGGEVMQVAATHRLGDPNITPSAGGFVPLSDREVAIIQGHVLRVEFVLEPVSGAGETGVHTGHFQRGIGQTGWDLTTISPGQNSITRTIRPPQCEAEYIFLGVWPEEIGPPGAVLIRQINVEVLEPLECE